MTDSTRPAPQKIIDLVDHFNIQLADYKAGKYNETQLRRDFLDPFFAELGWDMTNEEQAAERYREVINEVSVEVEGKAKAADYAFRIGGSTVFFLEAKKPSVNVGTSADAAFQIRRYAWSAKLPISIVSDFEQLAIYDCRNKPNHSDPVLTGRIELYHYTEFIEKWQEIYALFSKKAVKQGSLDRYATELKGKRGTADVDDAFLVEMERWREELARNIALRNAGLSTRQINAAVQLTIDRIIFLRICEERGIEAEDALRNATDGVEVYQDLLLLFQQADRKYNSGLFHFSDEKNQSSYPDTLTPHIKIDDKVLKDILANLYYPKCPYAFKYISADILGQVYERFLGKVIRLTAGHQAKVEEKPEVRKAGGVYYTPTYIVEYIVKNTVGELLKDKTPADLEKAPLRVLDPSCGSGSFLLGAYQFLLDWHLEWYEQNDPKKWSRGKTPPIMEIRDGWQLTMEKKKELLTSHIFGVDIDHQAVEVTKLSLLLKVVENPGQLSLLAERILPDLSKNIQCGNSLIGPDYYADQQMTFLDEEEQYRVNAFDWQRSFPQVFREGGFGAVIGNPPYLFITELPKSEKDYYLGKYSSSEYRFDVYGLFLEISVTKLINSNGRISFIIPHTILSNDSYKTLRQLLLNLSTIIQIVDIGPGVFIGAKNETMILILNKGKIVCKTEILLTNSSIFPQPKRKLIVNQDIWLDTDKYVWLINNSETDYKVIGKINSANLFLGDLCTINQGLRTGNNDKYICKTENGDHWKHAIGGKHIGRYEPLIDQIYVFYDPKVLDAPRKREIFESEKKIVIQEIRNITLPRRIIATYDSQQFYCLQSTNVINLKDNNSNKLHMLYLLGLLNSNLINYFFKQNFSGNNHIASNQLAQIPIILPTTNRHERMVSLVQSMLDMHKQLQLPLLSQEKEHLQRQISRTDHEIDKLVYELYGLTDEEIRIVEGE